MALETRPGEWGGRGGALPSAQSQSTRTHEGPGPGPSPGSRGPINRASELCAVYSFAPLSSLRV